MIIDKILTTAIEFPEKESIIFNDHTISYAQLDEITSKLAHGLLSAGISAGDHIAFIMPNLPQFIFCYYASIKIGAVIIPINYMLDEEDLNLCLAKANPKAIIYWEGFRKIVRDFFNAHEKACTNVVLGKRSAIDQYSLNELIAAGTTEINYHSWQNDDVVTIHFTAGITRVPTAFELTYGALIANINRDLEFFRFNSSEKFGAVLPLFIPANQNFMLLNALFLNAPVVLFSKIDYNEITRTIDTNKVSVILATPQFYQALLHIPPEKFSGNSLKYCLSSWNDIPDELENAFFNRLGISLLNCYCLTELGGIVIANHPSLERRNDSLGISLPGIDVHIHNEQSEQMEPNEIGEIVVRSNSMLTGYLDEPELTSDRLNNGWFRTGDLGKKDSEGYIYLIARQADVIVKSGFQIFTNEIEEIIKKHPKVKEAGVVAIPHPDHKEDVLACVVPKKDESINAADIIDFCKSHVPVYKCPQVVKIYRELPRTKMGKVLKRKLLENQ